MQRTEIQCAVKFDVITCAIHLEMEMLLYIDLFVSDIVCVILKQNGKLNERMWTNESRTYVKLEIVIYNYYFQ